jgi:hypothetical protein
VYLLYNLDSVEMVQSWIELEYRQHFSLQGHCTE